MPNTHVHCTPWQQYQLNCFIFEWKKNQLQFQQLELDPLWQKVNKIKCIEYTKSDRIGSDRTGSINGGILPTNECISHLTIDERGLLLYFYIFQLLHISNGLWVIDYCHFNRHYCPFRVNRFSEFLQISIVFYCYFHFIVNRLESGKNSLIDTVRPVFSHTSNWKFRKNFGKISIRCAFKFNMFVDKHSGIELVIKIIEFQVRIFFLLWNNLQRNSISIPIRCIHYYYFFLSIFHVSKKRRNNETQKKKPINCTFFVIWTLGIVQWGLTMCGQIHNNRNGHLFLMCPFVNLDSNRRLEFARANVRHSYLVSVEFILFIFLHFLFN